MDTQAGGCRRVVTGLSDDGVSHLSRIDEVDPFVYSGSAAHAPDDLPTVWRLWGHDELPFTMPTEGLAPQMEGNPTPEETARVLSSSHLPGPLGMRVTKVRFPPGHRDNLYWVNTVDVVWVLSGELVYAVDDGSETVVRTGDCVIQNAVCKAWHNRTDEPAEIGVVVLGAVRDGASPPAERFVEG
jgi:hypothetical protein